MDAIACITNIHLRGLPPALQFFFFVFYFRASVAAAAAVFWIETIDYCIILYYYSISISFTFTFTLLKLWSLLVKLWQYYWLLATSYSSNPQLAENCERPWCLSSKTGVNAACYMVNMFVDVAVVVIVARVVATSCTFYLWKPTCHSI